jgi:hypothetical protein
LSSALLWALRWGQAVTVTKSKPEWKIQDFLKHSGFASLFELTTLTTTA